MPQTGPRSFELTVPSRLEEMTAVHAMVEDAMKEYELSEDLAHWIELTISESMINAIQHGNKCDPSKDATLKISKTDDAIEVIVSDQAPVFEPSECPKTDAVEVAREGGYGIPLIKALADEIAHEPLAPRGNRVRLVKHQRSPA